MDRNPITSRHGMAVFLVIGLVLVLLALGLVLRTLSGSAYREVDTLQSHLRAVSVGEAMFGEISARLNATPWQDRWFRGTAEMQADVPIAGGSCSYVLQEVIEPPLPTNPVQRMLAAGVHHADLLVRARYERSEVVMCWRLTCAEDSIDPVARVIPAIYSFAPEDTPIGPRISGPVIDLIENSIRKRDQNRPTADSLAGPIRNASDPNSIAGLIGKPPRPGIITGTGTVGHTGGIAPPPPPAIAAVPPPPPAVAVPPPPVPPLSAAPQPSSQGSQSGQGNQGQGQGPPRPQGQGPQGQGPQGQGPQGQGPQGQGPQGQGNQGQGQGNQGQGQGQRFQGQGPQGQGQPQGNNQTQQVNGQQGNQGNSQSNGQGQGNSQGQGNGQGQGNSQGQSNQGNSQGNGQGQGGPP